MKRVFRFFKVCDRDVALREVLCTDGNDEICELPASEDLDPPDQHRESIPDSSSNTPSSDPGLFSDTASNPLKCDYCMKQYPRPSDLR